MTRAEATRKAAALLRLAARAGTPGEAAAAAGRAQSLLDAYELTRGEVESAEQRDEDGDLRSFGEAPEGFVDTSAKWEAWRSALLRGICDLHGCYSWRSSRGKGASYEVAGRPGAVETVRYFYGWLANEVSRLANESGRGMGRVWRREFSEGAAAEIVERLHEMRNESAAEMSRAGSAGGPVTALVVVQQSLARIVEEKAQAKCFATNLHRLVNSGPRRIQVNDSARGAGLAAGRGVGLSGGRAALDGRVRQIGSRHA